MNSDPSVPQSGLDPTAIAQSLLDLSGASLLADKFDDFLDCFDLPHAVETYHEAHTIASIDEMRTYFGNLRTRIARLGATHIVRDCLAATFRSETRILATHETRLMRQNIQLQDAYPVHLSLTRLDSGWRIKSGVYAVPEDSALHGVLTQIRSNDRQDGMTG